MNDLKLGSKVYWNDPYARRDRFREGVIDGETRVSWILNSQRERAAVKIPKRHVGDTFYVSSNTGCGVTYYLTREAYDNAAWVGKNKYRLIRKLEEEVKDVAKLKLIADMIGYKEEEK